MKITVFISWDVFHEDKILFKDNCIQTLQPFNSSTSSDLPCLSPSSSIDASSKRHTKPLTYLKDYYYFGFESSSFSMLYPLSNYISCHRFQLINKHSSSLYLQPLNKKLIGKLLLILIDMKPWTINYQLLRGIVLRLILTSLKKISGMKMDL